MAHAGPAGFAGHVELAGPAAPFLVYPTPAGVAVGMYADKPIDSDAEAEMVDVVAKTAGTVRKLFDSEFIKHAKE